MTPKLLVTLIALVFVVNDIAITLLYIHKVGFDDLLSQAIRFALTLLLSVFLIRGSKVARWISVTLLAVALIASIFMIYSLTTSGTPAGLIYAMSGIVAICLICLLLPFSGRHFGTPQAEQ